LKLRIVILGTRGFPNVQGGVEKHCECLSVNLVKQGCDVIVFTRKPYIDKKISKFKGVKLIPIPTVRQKALEAFLHTLTGVFATLRYKPDILHIQAIGPALFTPLAKLLGMKVVLTSHGSNYKHLKWGKFAKLVLKLGEFLGVRFADEVITVSTYIAGEIKNKYNRNTITIPNGVIVKECSKNTSEIANYGLIKGKYIIAVGRFVPEKGLDVLIDAFNILHLDGWKLLIAGRADHEDKYSLKLAKLAAKNDNILLPGFIPGEKLHELYSHAGLFVLPSYYEGLSISLLEAMSYGLPCIASDIRGNRNVELSDDRFFEVGNFKELAMKIEKLVHEGSNVDQKTKQIDIIAEKYNWENIAGRTLAVYQKVLLLDYASGSLSVQMKARK
jgi:glycosyltransferase involved in cell wall biosynthesis